MLNASFTKMNLSSITRKDIPMADTKNALAELAKRLKPKGIDYGDLCKAYRIVAELAKVEDRRDGETNSDVLWRCNNCIAKCRAIAEEGAKTEGGGDDSSV